MSSEWFYHVPHRQKVQEAPQVPLMSQIPGLSDLPKEEETEPHGVLIRDTDSKYIKLAKMGGRKNLLCFSQYKPSREPKKYPVPEWWGYKGTKPTEEQELELSKPRPRPAVPDYMVYQPFSAGETRSRSRSRIPFGQDGQSHWTRDEIAQHALRSSSHNVGRQIDVDKLLSETGMPFPKYKKLPSAAAGDISATHEAEPACLSKLLNYGYQRDWLAEREAQKKSDEDRRKLYAANLKATLSDRGYDVIGSGHEGQSPRHVEGIKKYQSPFPKSEMSSAASKRRSASEKRPWKTTSKTAHHAPLSAQESTKNLFKMKQFRDVPSKLDVPPMEAVY